MQTERRRQRVSQAGGSRFRSSSLKAATAATRPDNSHRLRIAQAGPFRSPPGALAVEEGEASNPCPESRRVVSRGIFLRRWFSWSREEGMKVQFEFTLAEVARRAVNRSPLVHRWRLMNSLAAAVLVGLLMLFATPWDLTIRGAVAASIVVVVFVLIFSLGRRRIYRPIGSLLVRDRAFADQQVRTEFLSLARRRIPAGTQEQAAPKVAQETLVAGPTEGDYLVAWLLVLPLRQHQQQRRELGRRRGHRSDSENIRLVASARRLRDRGRLIPAHRLPVFLLLPPLLQAPRLAGASAAHLGRDLTRPAAPPASSA